jgi:molybdopterin converting factor small subunit
MTVFLSGNLKRFADFESEVEIDATTIPAGLELLVERYPKLRPVVFDGEGAVRRVHRLYLNGEVLSHDEVLSQTVGAKDELGLLTALAGG